jgi:hypothetical protein
MDFSVSVIRVNSGKFLRVSVSPWWLLVFHADQKEPVGGCGGSGGGAVTQFEDAANVGHGEAAFADHQKCSRKVADHVMEKSVAADSVDQFFVLALPAGLKDRSHIVYLKTFFAALRIYGGEAGEIMLACHDCGGFHHARFVERIGMVVNIACQKRRTGIAAINAVSICLGDGRVAGMEFRRHFFHGKNPDGPRENVIEGAGKICDRNGRRNGDGGGLGQRVNACVSAARALGQRLFAGQLFDNGHQCSLNSGAVGLDLPTGEVMAIVSER